jgi:hypothetical protein
LHDLHAESGEEEFDEGEGNDQPARMGFKGIPTWEEVVGIMVTKNVESRSKLPSGGGQHHGRGQRGGRGGKRGR